MLRQFTMGFWHPFGPHGRETPDQIIERKRTEIACNGWTLWSFQYRRPEVLDGWYRKLSAAGGRALVFCSTGSSAVDPADVGVPVVPTDCRSYRFVGQNEWLPFPADVRVLHPFRRGRRQASAFVVQDITYPVDPVPHPAVEWLSDGLWRQDRVPTRGEYLIRPGGRIPLRGICGVLELRTPYLALVNAEDPALAP